MYDINFLQIFTICQSWCWVILGTAAKKAPRVAEAERNVSKQLCFMVIVLYFAPQQYAPENEPMWEPHPNPYHIEFRDPSKFKEIKTFTAYNMLYQV